MATRVHATISAMIPDYNDLAARYPRHVGLAQGAMQPVWRLAMTPETFLNAEAFAILGIPAVAAIADQTRQLYQSGQVGMQWDSVKKFAGVAIAVLMECNGFINTRLKRTVPHDDWNVGSCFTRPPVGAAQPAAPQPAAAT